MRFAPGLAPLRHRDFALYFTGLTVSQCGSWMEQTLTTWLLYDITGSPILLGIGGALRAVPIFTFGLLAGAIAGPRRSPQAPPHHAERLGADVTRPRPRRRDRTG